MVSIVQWWWRGLALDPRSLAALRIGFGLMLLLDLLIRATDLEAHYTERGSQPASDLLRLSWDSAYWSLHLIQGHWLGQAALFLATAVAYLCLTVGYHTRWAGFLSWALLISMQNRNPVVLDGGDLYFRCLLFWLNFCPWGACWSVDAARAGEDRRPVLSIGSLAYCWQITLIYAYAFLLKTGKEWTVEGTAVHHALQIDQITSPPAAWLLGHPAWMKFLNFAVLYFEGCAALLIWIHPLTRLLAVLGLTGLHLGLGAFMHLGVFAPIAALSSWGLMPGWFWERWPRPSLRWPGWPLPGGQSAVGARPVSALASLVLIWLLGRVTWCNWYWSRCFQVPPAPDLKLLRLDQQWNMFAPKPLPEDGYYVVVGETEDGGWINLWLNGQLKVNWRKPARVASMYPNARWRKLMMNLAVADNKAWREPLLVHLMQRWNRHHPELKLRDARLYFVQETCLGPAGEAPLEVKLLAYRARHRVEDQASSSYSTLNSGLEVMGALQK